MKPLEEYDFVIPPIHHTINNVQVTCANGYHLSIEGERFDRDISECIPLLEPARGRAGQILKEQPHRYTQSKAWYKSRCAWRGMDATRTVVELQAQLRDTPDAPMSKEMEKLVKKLRKRFLVENAKACQELEIKTTELREAKWLAATVQEKADLDSDRFKEEYFPQGKLDAKPVVIIVGQVHPVLRILKKSS